MAETRDLAIKQGKTFTMILRWEEQAYVYKPITAITKAAPARLTVPSHGVPDRWRVAVTNVKGMTQINAEANALKDKDFKPATVIDPNTIELNAVNASGFSAYASGGEIQYRAPVDITGFTVRMAIKDKVGGTELLSLTTTNGRITLDTVRSTITVAINAVDTAALTWRSGVYDIEAVSPTGVVTELLTGKVAVVKEVTA